MINRELIASEWSEKVVPLHNVPNDLFEHQLDAMALLNDGKHVFLGTKSICSNLPKLNLILQESLLDLAKLFPSLRQSSP